MIKLNKDQTNLIADLANFYASDRQYYVLSGQAGVGKTTCMRYFAKLLQDQYPGIRICMGGPTNKSTAVLYEAVDDNSIEFKTIYSLLGLRMMASGEVKELKDSGETKIGDFDLVIVDEGSMVNSILIDYVLKKTALSDTKIIFIGDREQLPPVNELTSPIWTRFKTNYELTEVMRHQNAILDFVQSIRANPNPKFVSTGKQVKIATEDEYMAQIAGLAAIGEFHNGGAKAIAWRNVAVDFMNDFIRQNNAKTKGNDRYVVGDRVVFREPVVEDNRVKATVDEEGTVISVDVTRHSMYPTLKAWKIRIQLDWGSSIVTAHIIHESSEREFQQMLDEFKNVKRWDKFWKLKEAFNSIAYGYALTAHRSQGSTFKKVFLDAGDIMLNHKIDERTKCLYVGASRAGQELWIFP